MDAAFNQPATIGDVIIIAFAITVLLTSRKKKVGNNA